MAFFIDGQEILTLNVDGTVVETITIDNVTVARKPVITTQPIGGAIAPDGSITLSVVADGLGSTMAYQWHNSDGSPVSGATDPSYVFNANETGVFGFYCVVSGFGGSVQSDTATVTVEAAGSAHVLTIGMKDGALYDVIGFSKGSDVAGNLQPTMTDLGDECEYLGETVYVEGTKFGGAVFTGSFKAGTVTFIIEGFRTVVSTTSNSPDYFLDGTYGCVFDATTTADFYSFLTSNMNSEVGVTIQFEPS